MNAHAFVGNVVYDLGMGVFRWADVVIGGLDNREARLSINRNCWRCNRPWIDGAIEQIQGTARVFAPDGPCYECTMSQTDWRLLQAAAVLQSALARTDGNRQNADHPDHQLDHRRRAMPGSGQVAARHGNHPRPRMGFRRDQHRSYQTEFQRKKDCYSHEILEEIVALDFSALRNTAGDLLEEARKRLGPGAELELARDVLHKIVCPNCKREEIMFASLGRVPASASICPHCPGSRRDPVTFYKIRGDESFIDQPLAAIGVPLFDVLIARAGDRAIGLELTADAQRVLGPLTDSEALEWL